MGFDKYDKLVLQKEFLRCEPLDAIQLERYLLNISWEDQEAIVNLTVKHPLIVKYPVKKSYQRSFLKRIIQNLEAQSIDIHDVLYEAFCELTADLVDLDEWFYKHYVLLEEEEFNKIITLKESASFVSEGTTGLCTWQAAHALSEYCFEHPELIEDNTILELGAGAGLLGLLLWAVCRPRTYLFSDCHPSVLKLLTDNITLNVKQYCHKYIDYEMPCYETHMTDTYEEVETCDDHIIKKFRSAEGVELGILNLPWECISIIQDIPNCNLILAADVVYDPEIIPALCNSLYLLLTRNEAQNKCKALIACTMRNSETIDAFVQTTKDFGLDIEKRAIIKSSTYYCKDITPVEIYEITCKKYS